MGESAAVAIYKLAEKSKDSTLKSKEDWCWHSWAAIGAVYFPDHDPNNTGQPIVTYLIPREAYRGLPPDDPEDQKPDVVVIRFMTIANSFPPEATDRDILWIECKAPDEDVPNRWKLCMNQAVTRLNNAHPNRRVFLILTTGLKWMPFLWDPPNQTAGMQQLPNANP